MSSKKEDPPAVPTYDQSFPSWAKGLPQEQISMYNQFASNPIPMPAGYGQASDIYNKLANYTPANFQYPMAEIQKALQAQQDLQFQQYQKQINPTLASQGQLDSTYHTNLLSDYLKSQQAQNYGTTANLLTNQATQNYDLSKWLPTLQGTAASGLQNVGTAQANLQNINANRLPTAAAGLGNVFGEGINLGDKEYNSAMQQYKVAMDQYNQNQANNSAGIGSMFGLGGAGVGALASIGLAPFTGGASLAMMPALAGLGSSLGSTAAPLFGGTSSPGAGSSLGSSLGNFDWSKLFNSGGLSMGSQDLTSSIYNPNFYGSNSFNPSAASRAFNLG